MVGGDEARAPGGLVRLYWRLWNFFLIYEKSLLLALLLMFVVGVVRLQFDQSTWI